MKSERTAKAISRLYTFIITLSLLGGGLSVMSCDQGIVTEEHMDAERTIVGANWQIKEIYLHHVATGQQEWRPASDAPFRLYFLLKNDNTYNVDLAVDRQQSATSYRGNYTLIGSTFYCTYNNSDLINFTYKGTKNGIIEGSLIVRPYSSQAYEVRLERR